MIVRLLALVLLVLSFPIFVVIGLCILLLSGAPIIFRQRRVGKDGKQFVMFKFRTMRPGAHLAQASLSRRNESGGPTFKIYDDPRFTPFGRFLSHTGLDELPQLVNVLRGEMDIIGPRPLPMAEAARLSPWMRVRHSVLPGIISPAAITGHYHKDFASWMHSDVAYAKRKNVSVDAALLGQGVLLLLRLFVREIGKML